jgi:ABC-type cobalamin transport system ATPase subunit
MTMKSVTVDLFNRQQAHAILKSQVYPYLAQHLQDGRRFVLTVKHRTRSIEQNSRLWAMLTDVSEQVEWYGRKLTPEDWKHVFSAALHHQDAVPGINGGFVVLGRSTSKMTVAEMCELQTLIEAFGADKGVRFRAPEGEH